LLRHVFHSQNLHGSNLDQHAVKNDLVSMRHQLAHVVRETGSPIAANLQVLCELPGLVAQLLPETARSDRIVLADVSNDGTPRGLSDAISIR
jgi:hypothetical protein